MLEGGIGSGGRQQDTAPGSHRHPTLFPDPGTRSPGEDRTEEALRPSALRVVRNQVDPSELEGRILGLGRGCPTDEEGDTRESRPPTHERGARQPVPRSSLRPLAGNLPSGPSQVLTAGGSSLSALSAVLRAHGSGARSRSAPQRCLIRVSAGSAPAPAPAPRASRTLTFRRRRRWAAAEGEGGGGGRSSRQVERRPRVPACRSEPLPAPPRSCRGRGERLAAPEPLPDRPLPARRSRHLPPGLLYCGPFPEDAAPQTSPPRAQWGDPRPGNPGGPIAAPSREWSGGRTGGMRGRRATGDAGCGPLPLPLTSSAFWALATSFPGADCGKDCCST